MKKSLASSCIVTVALLLLCGCVSQTTNTTTPAAASGLSDSAYAGFASRGDGALVHVASGAVFEKSYKDFVKLSPEQAERIGTKDVVVYDRSARDVSVNYMWFSTVTLATIYVYPNEAGVGTEETVRAEYERMKRDMYNYKNVTASLSEKPVELENGSGPLAGYVGAFTTSEGGHPAYSFIFIYGKNGWFIAYRVTVFRPATEQTIDAIVDLPYQFDYRVIE